MICVPGGVRLEKGFWLLLVEITLIKNSNVFLKSMDKAFTGDGIENEFHCSMRVQNAARAADGK